MEKKIEKMTYVKALSAAVACEALPADVREKLEVLLNQQVKRNATEISPEKLEANATLQALVLEVLARENRPMTITDLLAADTGFVGVSNQKCSSIIRGLMTQEKVKKTIAGRKAYFALA